MRRFSRSEAPRYPGDGGCRGCVRRVAGRSVSDRFTHREAGQWSKPLFAVPRRSGTGLTILAVTVLTSLDDADIERAGISGTASEHALRLARLAHGVGARGFVCSPAESAAMRASFGSEVVLVTPGISTERSAARVIRKRTGTPRQAIVDGADVLVVGRPIRDAAVPSVAARALLDEIAAAADESARSGRRSISPGDTGRDREIALQSRLTPTRPVSILGLQPVREAIRAHGAQLGAVLVERATGEAAGRLDAVARFAEDQKVRQVDRVARKELDALSGGASHQGAAVWAPPLSFVTPEELLGAPDLLAVALDGIQDPQNFGAAIRSAVALGATGIVWPEHSSAPLTPATFRASAGAVEHARLCRVPSLVRFLDEATASGSQVIGLAAEAPRALHELDLKPRTVLVIGSEHEGLGRAVRARCSTLARLTLRGPVDSLNASAACAVSLYVALIHRMNSGSSGAP